MAQRRMFSLAVVDTDAFLEMPLSSQALYFHLGMRADDDGFVSNAKRIKMLVGASDDDLKLLVAKRFLLTFKSGVVAIKHWKISNYIQKDRYRPTLYKEEKATLWQKPDGAYTDHPAEGAKPCLPPAQNPENPDDSTVFEDVSALDTSCIHSIGKVRLGKERLGKVSLGKVNNYILSGDGDGRTVADEAVIDYLNSRGLHLESYLGVYEPALAKMKELTRVVFKNFASREPNNVDYANVFLAVRECIQDPVTEEWFIDYPVDKQELLLYAFEQSARVGKPADWNYIEGVLKNLSQRGITTIAQAEQYDEERKG